MGAGRRKEIDPVEFAVSWGNSGIASLMYTRGIFNYSEKLTERLPDFVANFTRKRLDDLSYLLFDMNKLEEFYAEYQATQHKSLKAAEIAARVTFAPAKATKKLLQLLAVTGAINGVAAASAIPMVGSIIAVGAWVSFTFSLYKFAHETRLRGSYSYWLEDEMSKYDQLTTVINFMEKRLGKYERIKNSIKNDPEKLAKIEKKIAYKEKKLEGLIIKRQEQRQKIIYIAQVKKSKTGNNHSNELINFLYNGFYKKGKKEKKMRKNTISQPRLTEAHERLNLVNEINHHPTSQVEALVKQLRKNQRDRCISSSISCVSAGLLAVGATLVALSPVTLKAAPVVLGIGLGLSVAGLSIEFGKFASVKLVNFTSRVIVNRKEKNALMMDYEKKHLLAHPELAGFSKEKQFQYRLSFEHSLSRLRSQYPDKSESILEREWYQAVKGMPVRRQRRLLSEAEDLAIRNNKLTAVLKLGDMTPDERKKFIAAISNQDINAIVNRHNRDYLVKSAVKAAVGPSFFKKPKNEPVFDADSVKLSFRKI